MRRQKRPRVSATELERWGQALLLARQAAKLSRREVAAQSGLCRYTVYLLERAKHHPTLETIGRICQALHVAPPGAAPAEAQPAPGGKECAS